MKVLNLAGVAPSTVFSHVPLSNALRNAGHQVMVTVSNEELIQTIVGVGLPAVRVTDPDRTIQEIISRGEPVNVPEDPVERERMAGRWYARLEAATLDALLAFAKDWRPDVIVGGMQSFAAPLLATRLGLPWVRHAWDIHDSGLMDAGANDDLSDQLAELGLDRFPEPDMMIDITPPSLRLPDAAPAQMMRWIPGNAQCRLDRWMYAKDAETRIGVTVGTGVKNYNQYDFLDGIVKNVSTLDAEVAVAVTEDAAPEMRERLNNTRVGWVPLDVLAPTCDVLVHQSGGSTMMTALSFGVPQVLIPDPGLHRANVMARRVVEAGAGIMISPKEATTEAVAKACQEIITNPDYAAAASGLAQEIAALPLPSEVARRVEWLVHDASRGRRD
nr:protein of unknown function DUF1205 [uncultured bacterium]